MDFVVGGVGFGALAILVGLALRDGGAWWTRVRPSPAIGDEYAAALDAVCRRFGRLVALGGGLLLLVTLLALLVGASDRTGAVVVAAAVAAIAVALGAWLARSIRHQLRPLAAWPARPDRDPPLVPVPVPVAGGPSLVAPAHDRESGATGALEPLVPETGVPPLGVSSDQTGAPAVERSLVVETTELGHVNEHSSEPEPELDRDPDPGLGSRLPLPPPEMQAADSSASTAGEASPRSTTIGADHHRDGLLPPPDDLLAGGSEGLAPGEVTAITPPAPGVDSGAGDGDDKLVPVTQADARRLRDESS